MAGIFSCMAMRRIDAEIVGSRGALAAQEAETIPVWLLCLPTWMQWARTFCVPSASGSTPTGRRGSATLLRAQPCCLRPIASWWRGDGLARQKRQSCPRSSLARGDAPGVNARARVAQWVHPSFRPWVGRRHLWNAACLRRC